MRVAAYQAVATQLSLLSDRQLGDLVAGASPFRTGIGGRLSELDVEGRRVIVKRVPLTDIELRPENVRSTANLFGLPMFYQYGFGSARFGAWRELAVHTVTTNWVLAGKYQGFPLTYHWRVLPDTAPEGFADDFGGIAGTVAHWDGSPAVRERLTAIGESCFSLVFFLEYVPWRLDDWLRGTDCSPYPWVEEALLRGTAFMRSQGLVHFDGSSAPPPARRGRA